MSEIVEEIKEDKKIKLDPTKCKKCSKELTKRRVLKKYPDKYRVWCWCGQENFYYLKKEVKVND